MNLTIADVDQRVREVLRSQGTGASYAPKGTPWIAVDLPLVEQLPAQPQDRDEVNLIDYTAATVTRYVYVRKLARWLQVPAVTGSTSPVPAGVVAWTAASAAPTGWLLCDGSAVSRTTYADLFTALSTTYGVGDGSTTFNLPDLRAKMPIGVNGTYTLASTGGAATVTLSTSQIPSHTHSITSGGSHTHTVNIETETGWTATGGAGQPLVDPISGGSTTVAYTTASGGSHDHGGATGSAGTGGSHENLPPYVALNGIIRT